MANYNYTNDQLPNISVTLNQVRSTSTTAPVPFIPCIICKAPTGPIGELVSARSYTEAVDVFGLGNSATPALYGVEQYLKTYSYANIIRVAGASAAKGTVSLVRTNGDAGETTTITEYNIAATYASGTSYFVSVDNTYVAAKVFEEVDKTQAEPTGTFYLLNNGVFTTTTITAFDPDTTYYNKTATDIDSFQANINYYVATTVTVDTLGVIISGETKHKTGSYNGDTISLVYDSTRNKWYIQGTLNGVTYTTPKSTIDLSTAKADEEEVVLNSLVSYWNALNTGVVLENKFVNKLATDEAIDANDLISGTISLGDSGYEGISNQEVLGVLDLLEDPALPVQDVVCIPEFRNYQIVNAGLALSNTYFYIVSATGTNLTEKQASIANYDKSDKGVLYIPDGCIMNDPTIEVPFEIAALYAWATTYNVNRYYAPAGVKRATLDLVSKIINNLSDDDAAELYNSDVPANPVKYLTNYGYVIYGQKTMDATQKFTNRINVANLVNYILITGKELLQPFLFDYAPVSTFEKVYLELYNMLNALSINEVVYNDFIITCDSSNNTPETLRNHELHASIAVRPINVIEYIYLDLTVTDEIGEGSEE